MKKSIGTAAFFGAIFFVTSAEAGVWQNVDFGMSRSEIETLHPKKKGTAYNKDGSIEISDVVIIGKCSAEVNIHFDAGNAVDKIVINGDPSLGGRCSEQVIAGLSSKYGQPLDTDEQSGSLLSREGRVFIWNRPDGVTMRLKRFTNSGGGFGGMGGGLLKASWELTYTKLGGELAL